MKSRSGGNMSQDQPKKERKIPFVILGWLAGTLIIAGLLVLFGYPNPGFLDKVVCEPSWEGQQNTASMDRSHASPLQHGEGGSVTVEDGPCHGAFQLFGNRPEELWARANFVSGKGDHLEVRMLCLVSEAG